MTGTRGRGIPFWMRSGAGGVVGLAGNLGEEKAEQ